MGKDKKDKVKESIDSLIEIKAPKASHTKGFYRFSKFFPPAVNEEGFRDNDFLRKEPMSLRAKWLLAVGAVLVFCVSFVLISTAMMLSKKEPEPTTALNFENEFYTEPSASDISAETTDTDDPTSSEQTDTEVESGVEKRIL